MSTWAPGASPQPDATVLVLSGAIARADIPGLCERACVLLAGSGLDADVIVCDVSALADPDAVICDALARLQLTARRLGFRIRLRGACPELRDMLVLMGLDAVLPTRTGSGPEPGRQAEQREQARRIEEEADPRDPTA